MTLVKRKWIAWIALAAMLFGAVSPAIAAALFSGRAEILGRMLGIPVASHATAASQEAHVDSDGSAHESGVNAAHGDAHAGNHARSSPDSHDDSKHAVHGVFCSFCLSPGSTVALPAPAAAAWEVAITCDRFIPAGREQRPVGVLPSTHHPRDPPLILS